MQQCLFHKKTKVPCKIKAKIVPISKNNKVKANQYCKYKKIKKKNYQKIVKKKKEKFII